MKEDTVVAFRPPRSFADDPLRDVLHAGARQLLAQAVEAEVEAHIAAHARLTDAKGRRRVVRHGYLPERELQTGIGASRVKAPRARLKAVWWNEYETWRRRDLVGKRYVYFWADGIHFSPRMDHDKQCLLVVIAADASGHKDIVGLVDGYRESAQSWKELLLDLKRRGLQAGPELAVGDGALGFWKALREVYGQTREQRCRVHKTANVLNQMPKSLQARAKGHPHDIWMAETRAMPTRPSNA